ncbi:phosphoribosyltransferase family protein [Mucilaginibacter jinjuensis]|uniref:Phosphoribosyltransferase family protein n=1 Tax=Mucilaginibacter jinjuensis TaxID=1176721 RepID=A0ABY7T6F3_9SPHI|nr:phosphoribosyltransferase family protein [Mucilaginibacter jinjuensis]WCT12065.1 phosphoribosyltransferase family protein [Mucilaginibacter jinjuensis]
MQHNTYSLHKIKSSTSFGFSAGDYSRFKFGDDVVSAAFGTDLANGFIEEVLAHQPIHQQIVVISSPYAFIPTATFAMKNYFVFQLNKWLAGHGYPVVQETKVHRTITYKEDYGELNAEQRMSLIGNDSFHIDANFLEDKTLLFLDDIKITGSHERMISKMIAQYGMDNDIHMLYFAELVNTDIHPNIENYLNYHDVKSIFDLDAIVNSGHFCINTRIVKYILNYEHNSFRIFMQNQTEGFINHLYNMALGNSYHTMDSYALNLNYIKELLFSNKQKIKQHGN